MLTMNIITELGLCNGALGTLVHFVYTNGQQPPCLAICVIIQFFISKMCTNLSHYSSFTNFRALC